MAITTNRPTGGHLMSTIPTKLRSTSYGSLITTNRSGQKMTRCEVCDRRIPALQSAMWNHGTAGGYALCSKHDDQYRTDGTGMSIPEFAERYYRS